MKIVHRAPRLQREVRALRAAGERVGFVPTMGFLHPGHLSLVRAARRDNGRVVASVFVNPLQFGPGEDFQAYPRSLARDRSMLREAGVDLLFEPKAAEFYPRDFSTRVTVQGLDERLCGAFRPGHFTGVATVVMKLLAAAEPDRLYLGSKDFQQSRIIERMALDLNLGVKVILCPTLREKDGLAMSSRNSYLTAEERRWAPHLYRSLRAVAAEIREGKVRTAVAAERALARWVSEGPGRLQYAEAVDARTLRPLRQLRGNVLLALAYFLGRARLIDNVVVRVSPRDSERGRVPGPVRKGGAA